MYERTYVLYIYMNLYKNRVRTGTLLIYKISLHHWTGWNLCMNVYMDEM